jgi:hypothetical protein
MRYRNEQVGQGKVTRINIPKPPWLLHEKPCDYRFCKVNPMFEQKTGLHQVEGKTMCELVPHNEKHCSAF